MATEFVKIDDKAIKDSNYMIGLLMTYSDKAPRYIISRYASYAMNQIYEELKKTSKQYHDKDVLKDQLIGLAKQGRLRKHEQAKALAKSIYYTGGNGRKQTIYYKGNSDKLRYIDILTNAEIGLRRKGIGYTKYPFNAANKLLNPENPEEFNADNLYQTDTKGERYKISIKRLNEGAKYAIEASISYKASNPSGTTPLDDPKNVAAIDAGLKKYYADRVDHYAMKMWNKVMKEGPIYAN